MHVWAINGTPAIAYGTQLRRKVIQVAAFGFLYPVIVLHGTVEKGIRLLPAIDRTRLSSAFLHASVNVHSLDLARAFS